MASGIVTSSPDGTICSQGSAPMRRGERQATGRPPARERAMVAHAHTTSSIGRVLVGLAVLWGIIGLAGGRSWAFGDSARSRETLRGVQGVYGVIEDMKPDIERAGLTTQQLQTDVEVQLRKVGIRV